MCKCGRGLFFLGNCHMSACWHRRSILVTHANIYFEHHLHMPTVTQQTYRVHLLTVASVVPRCSVYKALTLTLTLLLPYTTLFRHRHLVPLPTTSPFSINIPHNMPSLKNLILPPDRRTGRPSTAPHRLVRHVSRPALGRSLSSPQLDHQAMLSVIPITIKVSHSI
jgi:hypothetical protein